MVSIQFKYSFEKNFFFFRFDNTAILLVSGVVLIFVFVLTLVFGIIRIVNTGPRHQVTTPKDSSVLINVDESVDIATKTSVNGIENNSDIYALSEDVTKLTIELIFTLLAILATFALFRYVKAKYAQVPTS
jgi:hypothetical protein